MQWRLEGASFGSAAHGEKEEGLHGVLLGEAAEDRPVGDQLSEVLHRHILGNVLLGDVLAEEGLRETRATAVGVREVQGYRGRVCLGESDSRRASRPRRSTGHSGWEARWTSQAST